MQVSLCHQMCRVHEKRIRSQTAEVRLNWVRTHHSLTKMKPEFSQWRDSGSLKIAKIKRLLNFASVNQHSMLLLNFSKLRMGHVAITYTWSRRCTNQSPKNKGIAMDKVLNVKWHLFAYSLSRCSCVSFSCFLFHYYRFLLKEKRSFLPNITIYKKLM